MTGPDPAAPGPGSLTWRLLGQYRTMLIIGRALVLEAAHPAVGASLARHSTYRAHTWRRVEHTLSSLQNWGYGDPEVRGREIGRLDRLHRHIKGTDGQGRSYDALDPAVRGWVALTLFEGILAMEGLAGRPLTREAQEELYGEWQGLLAAFHVPEELIPESLAAFEDYFAAMLSETLEDNPEVGHLLGDLYRQISAPPLLRWCPPLWAVLRRLAGAVMGSALRADLPAAYRERIGLSARRRDRVLSWTLHRGARLLMAPLPVRWRYFPVAAAAIEGRKPAPATHRRIRIPVQRRRRGRDPRPVRLARFFSEVLDQTGDGYIMVQDLEAMARAICWQLELTAEAELRVYEGFMAWWEQLSAAMDADGDGRISRDEFVSASLAGVDAGPDYLEQGLHRAMRAVFEAADTDGSGHLEAAEYRKVFGPKLHPVDLSEGFRQLDVDGDGQITVQEFLGAFTEFFTARGVSAGGTHLLGSP